MNDALQGFARQQLVDGLNRCTEGQVLLFKRMYAFKHLDWTIEQVVEAMPEAKLDITTVTVETDNNYTLMAKGQVIKGDCSTSAFKAGVVK